VIETMSQERSCGEAASREMPPNIEEVFAANGLSLFPFTLSEIGANALSDKANPTSTSGDLLSAGRLL